MSDGFAVYMTTKKRYTNAAFQRLFPKSPESLKFQLDETDVQGMIDCVEEEKKSDCHYLQDVLVAAVQIATRLDRNPSDLVAKLWCALSEWALQQETFSSTYIDPRASFISSASTATFQFGN